jgi:hypothetical protein
MGSTLHTTEEAIFSFNTLVNLLDVVNNCFEVSNMSLRKNLAFLLFIAVDNSTSTTGELAADV